MVDLTTLSTSQYNIVTSEESSLFVNAYSGSGKALRNNTIVPTPNGKTTMGELEVGDVIFGKNGMPCNVIAVYPQGVKPLFKVTFRDGSWVECCEEHLWSIGVRWKSGFNTMTTREIMDAGITSGSEGRIIWKYKIPKASPVEYKEKEFFIHPYVLGGLIGDGNLCNKRVIISVSDKDDFIINKIRSLVSDNFPITKDDCGTCPRYAILNGVNTKWKGLELSNEHMIEIKRLGLDCKSVDKFIPDEYMFSSIEQRKQLLFALMDTDGSCRKNRTSFSTSSARLANDVKELVSSLGGYAVIRTSTTRPDEYDLNIRTDFNPFSIKRKADNWKLSPHNTYHRTIVNIEPTVSDHATCITVDSDDHLFLVKDYIVTHNTFVLKQLIKHRKNEGKFNGKRVCLICFNANIAKEWKSYNLGIDVSTTHALGFKILKNMLSAQPDVDNNKYVDLFNLTYLENDTLSKFRQKHTFNKFKKIEVLDMLRDELLLNKVDPVMLNKSANNIYNALRKGLNCMQNTINYDDMLFGAFELIEKDPSLKNKTGVKYDVIAWDEVQDSDLFKVKLVELINPEDVLLVGDENQSIMQWNGSSHIYGQQLGMKYGATEYLLPESRRCPHVVGNYVTKFVPTFKTLRSNSNGYMDNSDLVDIGPVKLDRNGAIICRSNKPLFNIALSMLEKGIDFQFRKDVTKPIINFLKFRAKRRMSLLQAQMLFENFFDDRTNQLRANELQMTEQEVEIFETVINLTNNSRYRTVGALIDALEGLTDSRKGVTLSSIHQAKGLEWNDVLLIDYDKLEKTALSQDTVSPFNENMNLCYVAMTRTKKNLIMRSEDNVMEYLKK